ncbi:MAG: pro-sigmaK processing inhibitor BofA family protein [Candidatus Altiarchaeota archaeon]
MIEYLIALVVLVILAALGWDLIGKTAYKGAAILLNSIAGLLILLFLNMFLGWRIPVNLITVVICGLFGIPGIATLIILYLFGML